MLRLKLRSAGGLLVALCLSVCAFAADTPQDCADLKAKIKCESSKKDRQSAAKEFKLASELAKKGDSQVAFDHFEAASTLVPESAQYATAREIMRQQVVRDLLKAGNDLLLKGDSIKALEQFRRALLIDPGNDFAKQRILDAAPPMPRIEAKPEPATFIELKPNKERKSFHQRGSSQQLLESVSRAYGLTAFMDQSVQSRNVKLDVDDVDWPTLWPILAKLTKTFIVPLAPNQVLFAMDDQGTRTALQRTGMRSFYVGAASPQELQDLTNTLRILFDIRLISANPAEGTIMIRAPQPVIEAATHFIEHIDIDRPQVMYDVKVYSVGSSLARQLGTNLPTSFTIFNVPSEAQSFLKGRSVSDIISQLQNGQLSASDAAALAGLLGGGSSSLLNQPFVTFGGGKSLEAIAVPSLSLKLNAGESSFQSLDHVTVRAVHGTAATVKFGERYPILTSSYSSALSLPGRNSGLGNSLANYPSFTYEDLGITLKATPRIGRNGIVTSDLEIQMRTLAGTSVNGVPIISNREYRGSISAMDGTSIAVAGLVTKSDQRSLSGPPGLSNIPAAGLLFTNLNKNNDEQEILIVMTPHITSGGFEPAKVLFQLPPSIQR